MTVFIETTCAITMIIGSMILILLLVDKVVGLIRLSNLVGKLINKIFIGIGSSLLLVLILFAVAFVASMFLSLAILLLGVVL